MKDELVRLLREELAALEERARRIRVVLDDEVAMVQLVSLAQRRQRAKLAMPYPVTTGMPSPPGLIETIKQAVRLSGDGGISRKEIVEYVRRVAPRLDDPAKSSLNNRVGASLAGLVKRGEVKRIEKGRYGDGSDG